MKDYFKAALVCFGMTLAGVLFRFSRLNEPITSEAMQRYSVMLIVPIVATILVGFIAGRAKSPWSAPTFFVYGFIG